MSYGDSINVTNRPYNKLHHSRLVDHSFVVNYGEKTKKLNNVLNYAINKVQVPAIFKKDIVEISTSSRSQYKFIRNVLKTLKANYRVK